MLQGGSGNGRWAGVRGGKHREGIRGLVVDVTETDDEETLGEWRASQFNPASPLSAATGVHSAEYGT